jgi:hypothetical protein
MTRAALALVAGLLFVTGCGSSHKGKTPPMPGRGATTTPVTTSGSGY